MKSAVDIAAQPTRAEVLNKLTQLVAGRISREEASAWATRWVAVRDVQVADGSAWEALTSIGAADLYGGDRPYLYDQVDFRDWAEQLENAPDQPRKPA
jgi:hypothetical protein